MSDREFESYLALLGSLLRLGPAQRSAIANELRDHLEERVAELTGQGVEREEAIARALEEFGDAAGLAAQFSHVFWNRRRRWIMRCTVGSLVATAAAVLVALALWPQRDVPTAVSPAAAQELQGAADAAPAPAAEAAGPAPTCKVGDELDAKTAATLRKRVTVEFLEIPLSEVLGFLGDENGVQFYIRKSKLDDVGVTPDVPITIELRDIPLEMVLELVLEQADGLAYTIENGVIMITSQEEAETRLEVRVYNVRDLLTMKDPGRDAVGGVAFSPAAPLGMEGGTLGGGEGMAGGSAAYGPGMPMGRGRADMSPADAKVYLMEMLTQVVATTVEPDTWSEVGGPGTISIYKDLMVVNQTDPVHRKIDELLRMLRDAEKAEGGTITAPKPPAAAAEY